jgi:GxxExxY protein
MPAMESDPQTYAIIGSAMAVHRALGWGFLERVYQECLAAQFRCDEVPAEKEVALPIKYMDVNIPGAYRADFICFSEVVVELKVADGIGDAHVAQAVNYLRLTGLQKALILNFGQPRLEFRRVIQTGKAQVAVLSNDRNHVGVGGRIQRSA